MKLDFKFDWKVLLEFELNEFTLYITLLGIEHNVLIANRTRFDCNVRIFISHARDQYSVNIIRILECEGLIRDNLMCASVMLQNDSYMLILLG